MPRKVSEPNVRLLYVDLPSNNVSAEQDEDSLKDDVNINDESDEEKNDDDSAQGQTKKRRKGKAKGTDVPKGPAACEFMQMLT